MESLGEKLKTARTEKGLSFDQISRETNISIRFLEAMETENFSVFPGEPYVMGFLRNYGKYLDLDVQKLISLYKTLCIQEQPIPVEQLLQPQKKLPKMLIPVIVIIVLISLGGWGVFLLITNLQKKPVDNTPVVHVPVTYNMEGISWQKRLFINDKIRITVDNIQYILELINLGEVVTIKTPEDEKPLMLEKKKLSYADIDINSDGFRELRVTVVDFVGNEINMGIDLHFQLIDSSLAGETSLYAEGAVQEANTVSPVNSSGVIIIPASSNAYPFTLQSSFQGYCMFRWEIISEPDRRGRNQRYFQRSDPELSIQAQNGIRIWTSNAQAAKLQIIGGGRVVPVELGAAGEVVVAEIRWLIDEEKNYRLMLVRLEV
jgi:transcriptional regulator with XRE-family HTH domain